MRTTMQRRVVQTEIKVVGIKVIDITAHTDVLESIIVTGKTTYNKANKLAKEQYGHLGYSKVLVTDLVESEQLYEMEIDTFVELATPVQE